MKFAYYADSIIKTKNALPRGILSGRRKPAERQRKRLAQDDSGDKERPMAKICCT